MDMIFYRPLFHREFESLFERVHPPSVCIDNDTCKDCTLVKVDSVNENGILLEMVQVLTDLDLLISKSYICSDGHWFMDVFHVTDQFGNKITDEDLIHYIQQAMCANRRGKTEVQTRTDRCVRSRHVLTDQTALEITGKDRPGLMSELSATLAELKCNISAAAAWTHNTRVACIFYVEDKSNNRPVTDLGRLANIQTRLQNVLEPHHSGGERQSVRLAVSAPSLIHTERRLHQLMAGDGDYEEPLSCSKCDECWRKDGYEATEVSVDNCNEKGYSLVILKCRDRPKLLFDTVCVLTDMQYVVFHAAISSEGPIAVQEFFIRQKDDKGCTLTTENDRLVLTKCLSAAVERRVSHGLRLDVNTQNRLGLLSDVTRVFRENGLSIVRFEFTRSGEKANGSFYVKDISGHNVNSDIVDAVRKETHGTVHVIHESSSIGDSPQTVARTSSSTGNCGSKSDDIEDNYRFSLGYLLRSQLDRFLSNFRAIES